jgi:hypothetical protein
MEFFMNNTKKWMKNSVLYFYSENGKFIFKDDGKIDLADSLMLNYNDSHRVLYFVVELKNGEWTQDKIDYVKEFVQDDFHHDGYVVLIERTPIRTKRKRGFRLEIESEGESTESKESPKRFRKIKGDAKVINAVKSIENEFGLPKQSVRLNKPNGKVADSEMTVGFLRDLYEKQTVSA